MQKCKLERKKDETPTWFSSTKLKNRTVFIYSKKSSSVVYTIEWSTCYGRIGGSHWTSEISPVFDFK